MTLALTMRNQEDSKLKARLSYIARLSQKENKKSKQRAILIQASQRSHPQDIIALIT